MRPLTLGFSQTKNQVNFSIIYAAVTNLWDARNLGDKQEFWQVAYTIVRRGKAIRKLFNHTKGATVTQTSMTARNGSCQPITLSLRFQKNVNLTNIPLKLPRFSAFLSSSFANHNQEVLS